MENGVKERIKKFIEYKKISVREFERRCNLSNGYVNGINQTIMPNKASIINRQFPELNIGWLLAGTGEMLLSEDEVELSKKLNPANRSEKEVYVRYGANWKYPEYIIDSKLKGVDDARGMFLRLEKTNNSGIVTKNYNDIFGMIEVLFIGLLKYSVGNNMNRIINSYLKNEIEWEVVATKYKEHLKKTVELYEVLEPYKNVIEEIFEKFANFNDKHDRLYRFDDIESNTKP